MIIMENTKIAFEIAGYGTINAELYPDKAPKTVENFTSLLRRGFFDGLIFHRVIEGFMIQGGGYDAEMGHRDAEPIKGEFASNGFSGNDLRHTRGTLSMARTNVPDSASSQFFIMHRDAPHLDGAYAAFGRVTDDESLAVVDKIASVPTGRYGYFADVPREPVVITRAYIVQ